MVEPVLEEILLRGVTPKPTTTNLTHHQEPGGRLHQEPDGVQSPEPHIAPGGLRSNSSGKPAGELAASDRPGDKATSYFMSDPGRGRRHSQTGSTRRNQQQQQPQHGGGRAELPQNVPSTAYQGSPSAQYPASPGGHYIQQQSYIGQYAIPMQHSLAMGHPSTPPYSYPHGYQHPGAPDSNMMSQNMLANYQPMLQPHAPVYQYNRHSPDVSTPPFNPSAAMYAQHHQGTTPLSVSPHTSPTSPSPNFGGPGQFHSLRYPSPTSSSAYPYPPQSFSPTSPMYHSPQYSPTPYAHPYPSPSDPDRQGMWLYLPSGASVSSLTPPGGYPGYSVNYSPVGPPDGADYRAEPSHSQPSATSTSTYPRGIASEPGASSLPRSQLLQNTHFHGPPSPKPESLVSSNDGPAEKPIVRRSYHPNPPAHRSEWVMWAGNVPADASHDELWRFFNQPLPDKPQDEDSFTGVLSIFLISRSSCAFVNYESDACLQEAITRFNGVPLRPTDPRCPRLVCRVRRRDDDLKAGVGGQRGMGMHTSWIRAQKAKAAVSTPSEQSDADEESSLSDPLSQQFTPSISISSSSDEDSPVSLRTKGHSTGSAASTSSSVLGRYFPQRYFILKSLTQYDLDLSVEKGVWATQKHNEGILDQAYRTSKEVYLIFGVNKSGEFYGYAKMAGPVRQGEHRISWAQRTDSAPSSRSSLSPAQQRQGSTSPFDPDVRPPFFPPKEHRMVEESPRPFPTPSEGDRSPVGGHAVAHGTSAPPELGKPHKKITLPSPPINVRGNTWEPPEPTKQDDYLDASRQTRSQERLPEEFHLDETKPFTAMKHPSSAGEPTPVSHRRLAAVAEEGEKEAEAGMGTGLGPREESWGESFKIEWICTKRLPFHRTRHIRNPWNHDREVKVSRDGTELEPSVGQKLIEEWGKEVDSQQQQQPRGATSKRATKTTDP